jgi:hypothetical protein
MIGFHSVPGLAWTMLPAIAGMTGVCHHAEMRTSILFFAWAHLEPPTSTSQSPM